MSRRQEVYRWVREGRRPNSSVIINLKLRASSVMPFTSSIIGTQSDRLIIGRYMPVSMDSHHPRKFISMIAVVGNYCQARDKIIRLYSCRVLQARVLIIRWLPCLPSRRVQSFYVDGCRDFEDQKQEMRSSDTVVNFLGTIRYMA